MRKIFDEIIDRANTGSVKWDPSFLKKYFGHEDLLPLWVADMDFKAPQSVIDALVERVKQGYTDTLFSSNKALGMVK